MATYYVWDGGSNGDGLSWANAKTTFAAGLAAANATGDIVLVAHTHTGDNALAADTVFSAAANDVRVITVDKDNADTPTPMGTSAWIGHSSTNIGIALGAASNSRLYVYGLTLRLAGSSSSDQIGLSALASNTSTIFDNCYFWDGSGNSSAHIYLGTTSPASRRRQHVRCINSTFRLSHTTQRIILSSSAELIGCNLSTDGVASTGIFASGINDSLRGENLYVEGCDLSAAGSGASLLSDSTNKCKATLVNCKLPTSFVMVAGTLLNQSYPDITLYNCASGDTHYFIGHADAMGSTECIATIYPTTNTTGDVSWKITSTANASWATPYYTPWFDVYHSGTSAITPEIEILRDGSTTAYTNAEVWGDFSFQSNTGSPLSTIKSSRSEPLASGTSLTDGIGSGSWTNPPGTNKSSKIVAPSATTPAETGHLRARVCVGVASQTLYVDPTIRGI